MIAADKLALKANLTQGINQILGRLVDLYSKNLNSLGVQTSVVSGLAFTATIASSLHDNYLNNHNPLLSGLYYTFIQFALIATLLSVVLSTIGAAYGPSLALTGSSSAVVVYAVKNMQQLQEYVFSLMAFSIFCLIVGVTLYSFANYTTGEAVLVTILCAVGGILLFREALRTLQSIRYKGTKYLDELMKAFQGERGMVDMKGNPSPLVSNKPPPVSHAGYLWRRRDKHKGGKFEYIYCVVAKGNMEFYDSKDDFSMGRDRLAKINLKHFRVSTNFKEYCTDMNLAGQYTLGGEKFVAVYSQMFALIPIHDHEVMNTPLNTLHFQALSQESFSEWTAALKEIEVYYSKTIGNALTAVLEST